MANRRGMPWTPEEDEAVRTLTPDEVVALTGRTRAAAVQRRHQLRHPQDFPKSSRSTRWTAKEMSILRARWPTARNIEEVMAHLPRFSKVQLRSKAAGMKLKRLFLGDDDFPATGHCELIDQIRMRAKQDGIPLYKLDALIGTRSYFKHNSYRKDGRRANLHAVAKAIDFFGGTLVIDWRDR